MLAKLWRRRGLLATVVLACFLLAVSYLHIATYKYSAMIKVVPVEDNSTKAGGLASIAAIAGVGAAQPASNFDLFVDGLTDYETAQVLSHDPLVMQTIFAHEWDAEKKSWKKPEGAITTFKGALKRFLGFPDRPWVAPGAAQLRDYLVREIEISTAKKATIVSITLRHAKPAFARYVINRLHVVVDARIRQNALSRADASIAYINRKLPSITVPEYRQALVDIMAINEKQRMLASSGLPFAAAPVSVTEISNGPVSPKPAFVLALALLFGIALGALVIFLLPSTTPHAPLSDD